MREEYQRLGEILIGKGLPVDVVQDALTLQIHTGKPLGKILLERKAISEDVLATALAAQKKLEVVDLGQYEVNAKACGLVPRRFAELNQLIPIDFADGRLVLAMVNPLDIQAIDSVQLITGHKVLPVVATQSAVNDAIAVHLGPGHLIEEAIELASVGGDRDESTRFDISVQALGPLVNLSNSIISRAIAAGASDIHVEPDEDSVCVRYRIDGVMQEAMRLPKGLRSGLISRLKLMADMNIAERRLPQDGRCSLTVDGRKLDIRMSSLPGVNGEVIAMRLLYQSGKLIGLKDLGMDSELLDAYSRCLGKRHGSVLVTGPTGSGKTTTIYASLAQLNSPDKKIVTIEEPVEYRLPGITQVPVNRATGLTFAAGLRAIMRIDPDIVMVGEIRDLETAQIAVRSAMTGHLVLSTLHTRDTATTLTRLVDMGIDPFLVVSSVDVIIAQRLGRRLCDRCKQPYQPPKALRSVLKVSPKTKLFRAGGCPRCHDTGYRGRIGFFELLILNDEIRKLCLGEAAATVMKQAAVDQGMRTLYEDGLQKAVRGLTSIEEVERVLA